MAAFTWIQMSSLLILMLQFKVTTEQHETYQTVAAGRGHDVTLPCKNVIQGQHNCSSTTWIFSDSSSSVELFELGQNKEAKPKSDRLSLSADCSLVIKKVTDQDVGRYNCRLFKTATGSQEGPDFMIHLSVIHNVTTTKSAKSTIKPTSKIRNMWTRKDELKTSAGTLTTASNIPPGVRSGFIIVPVGLAALLITVVVIKITLLLLSDSTDQRHHQLSTDMNPLLSHCVVFTVQAYADDGVSYASISFTKKTKNKSRTRDGNDDGDTVTYSTVKASSSPYGVSTDPNNLYSTISN
ncbi:solute carrier family 14 (urea transporter) [Sarotherodon galilaeus]